MRTEIRTVVIAAGTVAGVCLASAPVTVTGQEPVPSRVEVRVLAHGAKLLGSGVGGARVTVRATDTGDVLAAGLHDGDTGDTDRIMGIGEADRPRFTTPGAARFTADLLLTEPRTVRIDVSGPLGHPDAIKHASTTLEIAPGQDVTGDGIVIELNGYIVEILEPPAPAFRATAIPVRARVRMLCGCPTEPGGLWHAGAVRARLLDADRRVVSELELEYSGEPSVYVGGLPSPPPGPYTLQVTAAAADPSNAGSAEIHIDVGAEGLRSPPPTDVARAAFERGLMLLHNFEYDDARTAFREARDADPSFASAYWGEALTYDHPLWGYENPEAARDVLRALGPTAADRGAKARSPRERRLLASIETLYGPGSKAARDSAYADSLGALHRDFPADDDVAALYGLALLGAAEGGRNHDLYMRAAGVLETVAWRNPGHPGALHYLIHAYDDPSHATLGLRPALLYSEVASESSHALHMPTHIFFALGRWDDAVRLNTRSWEASVRRAERLGLGREEHSYHPLFWLHYARLQQGDLVAADSLLGIVSEAHAAVDAATTRWHLASMRAQHLVHAGPEAPETLVAAALSADGVGDRNRAGNLLAAGLAVANGRADDNNGPASSGPPARALAVLDSLRALSGRSGNPEVEVMRMEMEALLLFRGGERGRAFALLEEAAARSDSIPFEFGPPPIVKPPHELAGELYAEAGDIESARRHFEAALRQAPGRALSLRGLEALAEGGREAAWRNDLEYLAVQLEARHPALFHSMSRERFREELRDLGERVSSLSDVGVALALARLLAGVGDGHTLVPLMWDRSLGYQRFPVELVRTTEGVSVLAVDQALEDVVGAKVLHIGNLPAEHALDSVATLIARDNEWTAYTRSAEYATVPEILHGLGITRSTHSMRLVVEQRTGDRLEFVVPAIPADAEVDWNYGEYEGSRPWLGKRDDPYWFTVLPDDSVAYVHFNRADQDKEEESVAEFGARLLNTVQAGSVRRIVLDLRWNRGGSRWRARHLLGALIAVEHALGSPRSSRSRAPAGHLVTLIGPNTFSAATQFALDLELHTNTAFVGLPTGGKPNHFGEVGRFRLPESGLEIRHSVYYHQATHARDTRPAIFPDQWVRWMPDDVFEGRDPVLEKALAWRPLPSALGELEDRIRANGLEAALAWLDLLSGDPRPTHRILESDLNRLGYDLLQNGRPEDAVTVFRRNLDRHPWSANAHDSLADGYGALGREAEVELLLCRAFAIDPQFSRALERGLDCGRTGQDGSGRDP